MIKIFLLYSLEKKKLFKFLNPIFFFYLNLLQECKPLQLRNLEGIWTEQSNNLEVDLEKKR